MRKLSFVAFAGPVRLPNVKQQTACNAAPGTTDRAGYNIDMDEDSRVVCIESRKPIDTKLDGPVYIPFENIKFFNVEIPEKQEPKK